MPSRAALAIVAALACAVTVPAEELPLPWFPPAAPNGQEAGLEAQIAEDLASPDVVVVEAADAAGEDEGATVASEAGEDPPPALRADADMSECARDLLRTRLATTVAAGDVLAAMALEAELLTLCRERQELVLTLHQVETALAELQQAGTAEGEATDVVPPLLDQFAEHELPEEPVEEEPAPDLVAAVIEPIEETPEEEPAPALAWFSILGVKGALRAGITDGAQVWWVTEGAALPGGATVASITGTPPAVVVAGEETTTLPYQRRPGGS